MGQAWFTTHARGHQYTALFLGLQSAKLNLYFPLELSRVFWVENQNEPNPYIPFRSNWFEVLLCFFPSKWIWHELEGRTKILVPDFLPEIDASLQKTWRSGWWYFWKLYFWAFKIACVTWDFFSCHLVEWLCGQSSPFFLLPSGPSQLKRQNHHQQRTEIPPKNTHTSLTSFKMPWIKSSFRKPGAAGVFGAFWIWSRDAGTAEPTLMW